MYLFLEFLCGRLISVLGVPVIQIASPPLHGNASGWYIKYFFANVCVCLCVVYVSVYVCIWYFWKQ